MVIVPDELIPFLDEMLMDLSTNRLEVCLIPNRSQELDEDGRKLRVAYSQNVDWYREFCANHPCTRIKKRGDRKDYTKIKRRNTILLLESLIKNRESMSKYAKELLDVAKNTKDFYDRLEQQEIKDFLADNPWDNQF